MHHPPSCTGVNRSAGTAVGEYACAANQGFTPMKFQSLTSIGGSTPAPAPSEPRVKIEYRAGQRPPTLDNIYDAVGNKKLMASPNVLSLFRKVITPGSDFHAHLEQFNFGSLNSSDIRDAEREGHDFIKHGLFQLPYPVCLYRCQIKYSEGEPLGISLLIVDGKGNDFDPVDKPGYATVAFTHSPEYMTAMHSINTLRWQDQPEGTAIQIEIPRDEMAYWDKHAKLDDSSLQLQELAEGSLLAIGLTMILNTKHIRKERSAPPAKPNKAREAKGRPLLPWVTRVYTSVYNRAVQPGTGTHASPRPHRRRAHVRHYPATEYREAYAKPIAAMLVNWDGAPLERGQYEVHGDD